MKVSKESGPGVWTWPVAAAILAAVALAAWGWRYRAGAGLDPDAVWRQGERDFQEGRYDRAESAVATLARLRPPTPIDWMLRAQIALYHKKDDEAVADLAMVPENHPLTAQARLLIGQTELRRKRLRFAERNLLAAAKADPSLVMPHRELIFIYGMQLRRPELNAQFLALSRVAPLTFDNAFHWCLTRNTVWEPKELYRHLRGYLDADPDDRYSRLALAETLRHLGQREEADRVLAPLPLSDPDACVIRVRLALDRNDEDLAESLLAGRSGNTPELDRLHGRLALARRDGPTALKHYKAAYDAEPDNRDGVFGLGQALALAGDARAAAPLLEAARDYDALGSMIQKAAVPDVKKDPELFRGLGSACEKVGRLPEARAWYNLAIQANALDPEAHKALFRLKERMNER